MLSTESAALVRATLPAVAGALDEITTRFYGAMFRDRPELLDGMFNRGNQASGAQRRALAGSIAGFATALLEDPDTRPDALLARIAHRHTAVGVTDDQYTIVHKYLFAAIAEVLGDAVTPQVAAAWDEVCWLMAGALIAQEARLYQDAGLEPGQIWRQWTVIERRTETPDTVSLLLRPADGQPAPRARAGQYVSVRLRMPHALRTETRELAGQLPNARAVFWYERPGAEEPHARGGLMNLDGIQLPDGATVFLCGPLPFMRDVRGQLLRAGVPARHIRYEVFGPDLWLPGPTA
ncbi:globin domain-containing protein [Streptomyces sp. NPDC006314]|uniref:globin domain-containing protein n=1 Tax=Streptomyces sp. NPDC006314 TaxID=3154475 RepID=UPI0033A5BFDF